MRIIIAGAGDVGFHLAKLLAYENQDIVLIDTDSEKLKYITNQLDVATIQGSATSYRVLEDAGIAKADLLISATSSEETNLTTAIIGKHLGAKRTVARISNVEYLLHRDKLDLAKLGIDEIISPASLAAKEVQRLLKNSSLTDTFDFDKGMLSLVGVRIDNACSFRGKSMIELAELNPGQDFVTVAILRNNQTLIPYGKTKLEPGDHAYFVAQPSGISRILELSGQVKVEIKNVMILGGSKVGENAIRRLNQRYNVTVIEKDKERCFELADAFPDALIINGDGRDVDLLKNEGLQEMDAFVALTGNSETNIISCLVAKNNRVKKTISLVENMDYIHLSQSIGVDTMINKKLIAANFIFRYVRKGAVLSITSIHGVDAEILEFEVKASSKICDQELQEVNFPHTAIIGGVIRQGRGYTAMGDFIFQAKDRVVVLVMPECIHKVEAFFK